MAVPFTDVYDLAVALAQRRITSRFSVDYTPHQSELAVFPEEKNGRCSGLKIRIDLRRSMLPFYVYWEPCSGCLRSLSKCRAAPENKEDDLLDIHGFCTGVSIEVGKGAAGMLFHI